MSNDKPDAPDEFQRNWYPTDNNVNFSVLFSQTISVSVAVTMSYVTVSHTTVPSDDHTPTDTVTNLLKENSPASEPGPGLWPVSGYILG